MVASFSPSVTSSLLNSTSFNNSAPPETELSSTVDTTTPPTSGITHAPTAATSTDSAAGDTRAQDDSKPIVVAAAFLAGSFALLTTPFKPVHNILLYDIYSLCLLLSFVLSIASLVSITTSNQLGGTAWVRRTALQMAAVFLAASAMLKIFLQQSGPIKWYDVVVPVLVLGGISMCFLIGWINENDPAPISNQTDSAAISIAISATASSGEAVGNEDIGISS